jgi:surface carbohydrate biosynthesis protein
MKLVVLPTSGLFQDLTEHELIVGKAFQATKLVDGYLSWGDQGRKILVDNGLMAETQIRTVGCPRFDFYSARYLPLIGERSDFLQSIGVRDLKRPIIVWAPANVASVAVGPAALARWGAGTNVDPTSFQREMADVLDQYNEHAPLIVELAQRRPEWTVAVKVHPSDQLSRFLWMKEQAPNIRVVQGVPVRTLLYHGDVLLQRASTTANEAWLLGKPVVSLATQRETWKISPEYAAGNLSASTLDDVLEATDAFIRDPRIPEAQERARAAFIAATYYRVDGESSERAAGVIDELVSPPHLTDRDQENIRRAASKAQAEMALGPVARGAARLKRMFRWRGDQPLRFWHGSSKNGQEDREAMAAALEATVNALYGQFERVHGEGCRHGGPDPGSEAPKTGEGPLPVDA